MTESKRKADEYRREAALCTEVADRVSSREDRERLLAMAHRWLALAREVEGGADRA